jgi:hypothetical protein
MKCAEGTWSGAKANLLGHSDTAINFYNTIAWVGGTAGIHFGVDSPSNARWDSVNSFDNAFRDTFRIGSSDGRSSADTASTALLWSLAVGGPLTGILKTRFAEGDCDKSLELLSDMTESLMLAVFATETTKVIVARERPFNADCVAPFCDTASDSRKSFFSGHSSIAAAGAGLVCSHSIRHRLWGDGFAQRAGPCALGVATAAAVGVLRIAADKHWSTDVLVGWAIGAVIGYFDVPGPFDLLKFSIRRDNGAPSAEGIIAPYASGAEFGARIALRF